MIVLFFLFWVICNGRLTLEIALFGLAISVALYVYLIRFLDYRLRYDWLLLKNLPLMLEYVGVLIREIVKANLTMAGFIFTRRLQAEPVLVSFRTPLTTNLGRVLLANSITLTPGTITLRLEDGEYEVHCYDKSMAVGLADSPFVRTLRKLEERMQ